MLHSYKLSHYKNNFSKTQIKAGLIAIWLQEKSPNDYFTLNSLISACSYHDIEKNYKLIKNLLEIDYCIICGKHINLFQNNDILYCGCSGSIDIYKYYFVKMFLVEILEFITWYEIKQKNCFERKNLKRRCI